jgi:hypothetical protein
MVGQPVGILVPVLANISNKAMMGSMALRTMIPTASLSSTSTRMVLISLRGGQAAAEEVSVLGLDLARTTMRLDSINTYSIITALLLQAALRLYADTPKDIEECKTRREKWATIVFVISAGVSIICGAYTCVVFSLVGLYSKSALGMGLDGRFLEFFAATAMVRKRAFDSFLVCLLSFEFCFTISLLLNYDGNIRWWACGIATLAAIFSVMHWQSIITLAGRLLLFQK